MIKSGYYYPNRLVLATFNALEYVMGRNGLNVILNIAHLRERIDHYPADNLKKGFDFAEFTAIQMAIEEMYGEQGGRALIKRTGRTVFSTSLCKFGALAGVSNAACRCKPDCASGFRLWHEYFHKSVTKLQPSRKLISITGISSTDVRIAGAEPEWKHPSVLLEKGCLRKV